MEYFLNKETVQASQTRVRRLSRILFCLIGLTAAVFIALCLLTRTGNARVMLLAAMAAAVLGGFAVIAVWMFGYEPAKAEERHLTGLTEAASEIREGRFFPDSDVFRIPKSVRVRKIRLETDSGALSLNLNDKLTDRIPPAGSLVRAAVARKFITGIEVLEEGTGKLSVSRNSVLRNAVHVLGRFFLPAVLWIMVAVLFTGFIFNQITDTAPKNKLVLYADCEVQNAPELAEKLESALDGAVRMVKIHPFSYALFDSARLKQADLFIIPDSRKAEYQEWLSGEEGFPVFDPDSGLSVASAYFLYLPAGTAAETYRLYTGGSSVHLEDGLARRAAEILLSLTEPVKETTP